MYKISYNRTSEGIYISTSIKEQIHNNVITNVSNQNYMSIDQFKTKYNIDLGKYKYFSIEKNEFFDNEDNVKYLFGEETDTLQINWVSIEKSNPISSQFFNIIDTILDEFVQYQMNEYNYKLIDSIWTPDIEKLREEFLSEEQTKYLYINNIKIDVDILGFSIKLSKIDDMMIKQSISLNELFELPVRQNDQLLIKEFNVSELQTISDEFKIKYEDLKINISNTINEIKTTTDINYFIN